VDTSTHRLRQTAPAQNASQSRMTRLFKARLESGARDARSTSPTISLPPGQASLSVSPVPALGPGAAHSSSPSTAPTTAIHATDASPSADPLMRDGAIVRPPISPHALRSQLPLLLPFGASSPREWHAHAHAHGEHSAVIRAVQAELAAGRGAHGKWRSMGDVPMPWEYEAERDELHEDHGGGLGRDAADDGLTEDDADSDADADVEDVFAFTHEGPRSARSAASGRSGNSGSSGQSGRSGATGRQSRAATITLGERALAQGPNEDADPAGWGEGHGAKGGLASESRRGTGDMGIYEVLFRGPPPADEPVKTRRGLGLFAARPF
jgi:hypothetical protein